MWILQILGLYRAAILESGTSISRGLFIDHARNYSFAVGRALNSSFTSNDSKELLTMLRKASLRDILAASNKVSSTEFCVCYCISRQNDVFVRHLTS